MDLMYKKTHDLLNPKYIITYVKYFWKKSKYISINKKEYTVHVKS